MQQKQMNIELRSKTGKGISRLLRNAEMVPGVVYGKGMDPMAVSIKYRDLQNALAGEGGQNNLITLIGGGSLDQTMAIIADLQRDAIFKFLEALEQAGVCELVAVLIRAQLLLLILAARFGVGCVHHGVADVVAAAVAHDHGAAL